ncbi:MAG: cytochrome c oxidase subunit II transmembrane domain-containing protein [Gammaproteobacteria bacterium]
MLPYSAVLADREVILTPGVTEISRSVYNLHMLILWICVVVVILVFGVIIYSIVKHRKSQGSEAAQFHESAAVEIIWAVIPFLILIAMAVPSVKSLIKIEDTRNAETSIVVGTRAEDDYMAGVTPEQGETKAAQAEDAAAVDKTWTLDELMAQGEDTYNTICAVCHQVNGQGLPPTFPALAGSAVVTGDISQHVDIVLNGRSGTAMLGMANQLSDLHIAAVITFERNSWGNDTGDVVRPADVQAAR